MEAISCQLLIIARIISYYRLKLIGMKIGTQKLHITVDVYGK